MDTTMQEHSDFLYIGGRWVRAQSAERIAVTSPLTETVIGSVPAPTDAEADAAVAAARASFDAGDWRRTQVTERIDVMLRLAAAYQDAVTAMGRTLTAEMGAPIGWTTGAQAGGSVAIIRAMAQEARRYPWEEERLGGRGTVLREPVGVVVAIPPWNVAQTTTLSKLVPALPAGTVSILPAGRETGQRLVASPDVDHVAFTGSTAAGRSIAAVCGRDLRRGEAIARQVRTGMIGVNGFRPDFSMPFGGIKASGIGREFGREGLDAYTEPKALYRPVPA